MIKEFRDFVMRGNVLDLAVAVILGVSFAAVVNAFTDGILMALVAALFGKPSFDNLTLGIGDGVIRYGTFLTALVTFLIIAFVLFLIVRTAGRFQRTAAPAPTDEAVLLAEIRDLLASQGSRASATKSSGTTKKRAATRS